MPRPAAERHPHQHPPPLKPTARQLQVLSTVRRLTQARGWAPTIRELMDVLHIESTNAMKDHLVALQRKGLVDWEPSKARTLHLTVAGYRELGGASEAA